MIIADDGQMEESWRVASTAADTSVRDTSTNPIIEKNDAALVVARKTSLLQSIPLRAASTIALPQP